MSKKYTKELKLKAVKRYLEDGIGSTPIAKDLELSSNKRVLLWVKRYKEFGEAGLDERRGKSKTIGKGRSRKREMSLEEENLRLKAEIDYLKKLMIIER